MGNSNHKNQMEEPSFTMTEIQKHNTPGDAWMVIKNKVYDVSSFNHPGGGIIKIGFGKDATKSFHSPQIKHSSYAKKLLNKYYIGVLDESDA